MSLCSRLATLRPSNQTKCCAARNNICAGGFSHVQHVRPRKGPTTRGPHRPENVGQLRDIYWLAEPLHWVLRHWKVHLVQHDIVWRGGVCTPYCEFWNLRCYSCNAEFTVSFRILMSENVGDGPRILPTRVWSPWSGLNPAWAAAADDVRSEAECLLGSCLAMWVPLIIGVSRAVGFLWYLECLAVWVSFDHWSVSGCGFLWYLECLGLWVYVDPWSVSDGGLSTAVARRSEAECLVVPVCPTVIPAKVLLVIFVAGGVAVEAWDGRSDWRQVTSDGWWRTRCWDGTRRCQW